MDSPTSPQELIPLLRRLADRAPASRDELRTLQGEFAELAAHISVTPSLANSTPEAVWHFLSDADIRFKDPAYAKAQLVGYLSALAQWERQSAA